MTNIRPRRTDAQKVELENRITALFNQQICFNEFMGFKVSSLSPGALKISFSMRPELIGHYQYGRLHGGVISSVLDVSGGLAVMMGIADYFSDETADQILARFTTLATIDLRVDYLRQGIGSEFVTCPELVRLGKRVGVTRSSLFNDEGTLIATGNASYIVS